MAIIKDFPTNFGITANYHRLLKVEVLSESRSIFMTVGVYVSQEARDMGGVPVWNEYVSIPFENLSFDPRDIFYPLLQDYNFSYLEGGQTSLTEGIIPHPPVFELVEPPSEPQG